MTNARPDDKIKSNIIALAKAAYGGATRITIAKAAGEILFDHSMEPRKNIQLIRAHLQQFPFDEPEEFAQKAYGYAKKKAEEEMLKGLKLGLDQHEYLDGSEAPKERPAPRTIKKKTPKPVKPESVAADQQGAGPEKVVQEKPTVKAEETTVAKRELPSRRPGAPSKKIEKYEIRSGLTSLGITAESAYRIKSTQGKPLQIKVSTGLSPRLDPKKKEVRIISGMGLLEGSINNGDFIKGGYAPTISKNGREVYLIDFPERVGILLPVKKKVQLKSSVAEKLAEYVQGVKNPTAENIIDAVQQCREDLLRFGSRFNMHAELKLLIFPVPAKDKSS